MYSLLLFNFLFYIGIFIYNLFLFIYYIYTKSSDFLKSSYYYVFNPKTVYIIRGLPGSGKTSWCLNFLSNNNLKISDNIIYCSCAALIPDGGEIHKKYTICHFGNPGFVVRSSWNIDS